MLQASEIAFIVQSQRDLGCQATQVIHLEEGVNSESSQAMEFWNLLGGRTEYKGECLWSTGQHLSCCQRTIRKSNN